jgi:polyferredoxin
MASIENQETYRDSLATIDKEGKRVWIYPKKPQGRFYEWRTWVSFVFLAFFLVMPFIKIEGEQILQFNILRGQFNIFGLVFGPQDFHLFLLVMLTFLVFIILFTVVWGRLFCGWVCPQTVFMEMVFRKIEYWIEGDANQQRKLDKAAWSPEKLRRKALKHALFFAIAVVVANYFLAYIIGTEAVLRIIREPIAQNLGGFAAMLLFSAVFYGVFARLREQVCTTICPYGRLQGVLLVPESIVVAYDYVRGEPRGKLKKEKTQPNQRSTNAIARGDHHDHDHHHPDKEPCGNGCANCPSCAAANGILKNIETALTVKTSHQTDPSVKMAAAHTLEIGRRDIPALATKSLGDCIDCGLCVQVCPTGIDIRNGTQLECVNCTACIDACDEVMDKIKRPRGLIRYDSLKGIETGRRRIWTVRSRAYSVVLSLMILLDVFLLVNRSDVEATILRSPGQLFQVLDEQHIANLYTYKIANKTHHALNLTLKIKDDKGVIRFVGNPTATIQIPKMDLAKGAFFVDMANSELTGLKTTLVIEVYDGNKLMDKVKTNFVGPITNQ